MHETMAYRKESRGDSPTFSFLLEPEVGKSFAFRDVQADLPYTAIQVFTSKI